MVAWHAAARTSNRLSGNPLCHPLPAASGRHRHRRPWPSGLQRSQAAGPPGNAAVPCPCTRPGGGSTAGAGPRPPQASGWTWHCWYPAKAQLFRYMEHGSCWLVCCMQCAACCLHGDIQIRASHLKHAYHCTAAAGCAPSHPPTWQRMSTRCRATPLHCSGAEGAAGLLLLAWLRLCCHDGCTECTRRGAAGPACGRRFPT